MNATTKLGAFAILLSALGCAAPSTDAETTAQAARTADRYHVFATRAEMLTWAGEFRERLAIMTGSEPGPIADENHPLVREVDAMVKEQWPIFARMYPDRIDGLAPPRVVLFQDETANAAASMFDTKMQKLPHVFIVHAGIFAKHPRDEVAQTIAHELAHHTLQHGWPGRAEEIRKVYRARDDEPFGFEQHDDPSLKQSLAAWTTDAELVGPFPRRELDGVPYATVGMPALFGALSAARRQMPAERCERSDEAEQGFVMLLLRHFNAGEQTLGSGSIEESEALTRAAENYRLRLRDCVSGVATDIFALLARTFGVDEKEVRGAVPDDDVRAALAEANLVDQASLLTRRAFERMQKLEAPLEGVRMYTYEEEADEAGVHAIARLGRDPRAAARFFLRSIEAESDRKACEQKVNRGEVPGYGTLNTFHHSNCWRVFHIERYATLVERGRVGPPTL